MHAINAVSLQSRINFSGVFKELWPITAAPDLMPGYFHVRIHNPRSSRFQPRPVSLNPAQFFGPFFGSRILKNMKLSRTRYYIVLRTPDFHPPNYIKSDQISHLSF